MKYIAKVARSPVFHWRSRISDPFSRLPEGSHREEQLQSPVFCSSDCRVTQTTLWHVETSCKITIGPIYKYVMYSVSSQIIHWGWASAVWQLDSLLHRAFTIWRYDTRCYFNVRSKADIFIYSMSMVAADVHWHKIDILRGFVYIFVWNFWLLVGFIDCK